MYAVSIVSVMCMQCACRVNSVYSVQCIQYMCSVQYIVTCVQCKLSSILLKPDTHKTYEPLLRVEMVDK